MGSALRIRSQSSLKRLSPLYFMSVGALSLFYIHIQTVPSNGLACGKGGFAMDYEFFMEKALEGARQALTEGEFPVGCVMACEGRVLVTGRRRRSTTEQRNELDHAEMLALERLVNVGGNIQRDKVIVFSTLEPCLMCYGALIVNGIRHIVYAYEDVLGGGTGLQLKSLAPFYQEMEIEIVPGILRQRSLDLFKKFFSDPHNDYLRGSILAQHALDE
jgi:tRNA(adenine34) deaminase